MVSFEEISKEDLQTILESYIEEKSLLELNNFSVIIDRAIVNSERNVVTFKLAMFNLILDTRDLSFVDAHPNNLNTE